MSLAPLYVTRPSLPPFEEFEPLLREVWASARVANGGPFHKRLEAELAAYLDVPHVSLFANGTLALLVALRALGVDGEVITTPYSFVATSHVLRWSGCTPVFADIDAHSLGLDPVAVEAAITPRTRAILPVHVYGRPCDTGALETLADARGLRLIYDAAHAFGVRTNGGNLLRSGHLSVMSFHATKVFHTFEGGAIVCHDRAMKEKVDLLKNFGFKGETEVIETGINAKMNEFQAAFGCHLLGRIDGEIAARAEIAQRYREGLAGISGVELPADMAGVARPNHAYFPIFVKAAFPLDRDGLYRHLREHEIYARRYFHPLISDFSMYRNASGAAHLPFARAAADAVLCLPIFAGMTAGDCERVVGAVRAAAARAPKVAASDRVVPRAASAAT
ncbi:MAG TPA: DegT/DnrJ/EryC1/StrS family aminotransferase [Rhodocyclaceae bacterium]|nr:DegT/DnrJ/EryC1/StrS family aminotransferase [Rhodocyclaceae bacterium]HNC62464.1 DegT/DnrJ/EryC1/StrS family aminotransferase [Rhodocyclaceae bacterium]